MEDYELRWQRNTATPRRDIRASSASRDYRASSASRDYRESSMSRDMRESSVLSSTSRNVRSTSVLPASLKHYDDLAEADEDYSTGYGYDYLNRGLHQAKRALSEARDIVRATSIPRESSMSRYISSSSAYDKKSSRLEDIKEFSSEILREREENKNLYSAGTYKITVTPQAESWSTRIPRRLYTRSTIAALLAAYSPRHYPDFIFGRYGGSTLHKPISSTSDYYNANHHSNLLDSTESTRKLNSYDLDSSSYDAKYNRSSLVDSTTRNQYDRSSVGAFDLEASKRRSSYEDEVAHVPRSRRAASYDYYNNNRENSISRSELNDKYNSNSSRYNSYDFDSTENSTNIIKDKKNSKYYHYYIPRHYPGTPMRGGYLVNAGKDYGWKY